MATQGLVQQEISAGVAEQSNFDSCAFPALGCYGGRQAGIDLRLKQLNINLALVTGRRILNSMPPESLYVSRNFKISKMTKYLLPLFICLLPFRGLTQTKKQVWTANEREDLI